jgi:Glycosyl transferase family 90
MAVIEFGRRRAFIVIVSIGVLALLFNVLSLMGDAVPTRISNIHRPGRPKQSPTPEQDSPIEAPEHEDGDIDEEETPGLETDAPDPHPIHDLRLEADQRWRKYGSGRSRTFRRTVEKYRNRYGRHPPPGFKEWYKFAREKNVFNIDDFEQVMDDLRPFWAIDPKVLRKHAAHMSEDEKNGISGIHIRNHAVVRQTNPNWRSEILQTLIEKFVKYLPDMDIAMNRLDQPRTIVPWEDMQELLAKEHKTRALPAGAMNNFTEHQDSLLDTTIQDYKDDPSERLDAEWIFRPGKPYMDLASLACPPGSPARSNVSIATADAIYKHSLGGLVTNFNRSTDLCTAGPAIQDLHGFLYSASSITASKKLLPVFGECKVNVNSDILFPANMYYANDVRYDYSSEEDLAWEDKADTIVWRGVTSGGVQNEENWSTMHRQRLVQLLNGTHMSINAKDVSVISEAPQSPKAMTANETYENFGRFQPGLFAEQHADVGFVKTMSCIPDDCPFYRDVFTIKPEISLSAQFRDKYLIDVDGHSFSGRWRAFLESKSLGFKATIFREWHDSRLFAWRHFIPVDNRYDDLYSLLTYFIGYGKPGTQRTEEDDYANADVYMPSHETEAKKIARQGREWAKKVLRRDDIEVYMFRLLLEYGRIIDDNRDWIGYSEDGSELDKFDQGAEEGSGSRWGLGRIFGKKKKKPEQVAGVDGEA